MRTYNYCADAPKVTPKACGDIERANDTIVFRALEISNLVPGAAFNPLPSNVQDLLQFKHGWRTSCVTLASSRFAFNKMNNDPVSMARAAVANIKQEFWRTSGIIRRIRWGMDARFS